MKNLRIAVILTISALFTLTACSKKNDDVTPTTQTPPTTATPNSTGFFTKIDGKEFRPDLVYA